MVEILLENELGAHRKLPSKIDVRKNDARLGGLPIRIFFVLHRFDESGPCKDFEPLQGPDVKRPTTVLRMGAGWSSRLSYQASRANFIPAAYAYDFYVK